MVWTAFLAAQDPAWHQIPKDDLAGNRGEIAGILQSTATQEQCLQIPQRPETDNDTLYLKMLACKRLGTHGNAAAAPQLIAELDKDKEGFYVRYALETIPGAEVDAALCEATKQLKRTAALAGVLTTLGVRAEYYGPRAGSAETAKGFLGHDDAEVRKAAAYAFAWNGGDGAVEFFTQKGIEPALSDSGFLLAEVFMKKGDQDKAIRIYDALAAADIKPYQRESAVYRGILARGDGGIDMLVAQLNSESPKFFDVGLKAGRELPPGAAVTRAMVDQLAGQKDAIRKARLVRSIGDRHDAESKAVSLAPITESARSGDEPVRVAAIDALKKIGDASVLPLLFDAAVRGGSPAVVQAAKNTLAELSGKEVDDGISRLLEKGDPASKIVAIGLIEDRRIVSAFALLQKELENSDKAVRDATLDALGQVGSIGDLPKLLDTLVEANTPEERKAVQNVLLSACTRMPQDAAASEIAQRLENGSVPISTQLFLLDLLKQIAGAKAIEVVESHAWGSQPDLQDRATAILGDWRSPQEIDRILAACLKIAKEAKENRFKYRGVRGYLRPARYFDMPEERRIAICEEFLGLSDRNVDRIIVFEVYGKFPSANMLALTMKQIDNDAFREKACETAVAIGEKLQGKSPETAEAMKKVIEKSANDELKGRARRVLEKQ